SSGGASVSGSAARPCARRANACASSTWLARGWSSRTESGSMATASDSARKTRLPRSASVRRRREKTTRAGKRTSSAAQPAAGPRKGGGGRTGPGDGDGAGGGQGRPQPVPHPGAQAVGGRVLRPRHVVQRAVIQLALDQRLHDRRDVGEVLEPPGPLVHIARD